ncbi:unnamed protein product [Phytomonas sp. EM1]|nr:unnamed protein product [Phytomonas sp. EM1]|eukprot:CCW63344.1 unnamed protein product [Phytomonas sp. isolate EM1]
MLLITWNTAGWSSTVRAIRESYGSVARFLHLTGADIICLQECKGSWEKLQSKPIEMGADDPPVSKRTLPKSAPSPLQGTSNLPGEGKSRDDGLMGENMQDWESFWSFSEKAHKGFNGVVTFVRKGLTLACDARPFDKDDLNDEGRVVVTHHSAFVLFNVYVPNARGSARSEYKKYFLHSLVAVMDRVRQTSKKPLIFVGDLNMTYRAEDAAWTLRRLDIGRMVELNRQSKVLPDDAWESTYPYLSKPALGRLMQGITQLLWRRALEIVRTANSSSSSSSSSSKKVDDRSSLATVKLDGEPRRDSSRSTAHTGVVSVDSRIRDESGKGASELQKELQIEQLRRLCLASTESNSAKKEFPCTPPSSQSNAGGSPSPTNPSITLEELYEAGFSSVFIDEISTNPHANSLPNRELYALTRYCGLPPHDDESIAFMDGLLNPHHALDSTPGMRDTFAMAGEGDFSSLVYCPCPFTCWDQSRNRRQMNEGTRLDYVLVDAELAPHVVLPTRTENNHPSSSPSFINHDVDPPRPLDEATFFTEFCGSARAEGVRRAMAGGLYPPAAFDRSGIPPLSRNALDIPFRGLPSTGLFITPPQFSDHIGMCVLFRPSIRLEPRADKILGASKCLYRPPVGLRAFMMKPLASGSASATNVEKKATNSAEGKLNFKLTNGEEVSDFQKEKKVKVEVCHEQNEVIDLDGV